MTSLFLFKLLLSAVLLVSKDSAFISKSWFFCYNAFNAILFASSSFFKCSFNATYLIVLFFSSKCCLVSLSATYKAFTNSACFSLIVLSYSIVLPSAFNLISKGIVYPLWFFQFETQAGIFQSSWSCWVSFLVGECITVFGGDFGPPGIFLCLN